MHEDPAMWIGHALVKEGKLSKAQLDIAINAYRSNGRAFNLAHTLELLQLVSPQRLAQLTAQHFGLPIAEAISIDRGLVRQVPQHKARTHCFVPFKQDAKGVHIATADPNKYGLAQARQDFALAPSILIYVAARREILAALDSAWREQAYVVNAPSYFESLIEQAVKDHASDVHLEPKENSLQVRVRIDGELVPYPYIPDQLKEGVIQTAKLRSNIVIHEKLMPQDGDFKHSIGARRYKFRVSTIPTIYGEKVVIRIQEDVQNDRSYEDLGMWPDDQLLLTSILNSLNGLIVFTGPTGSGKSTLCFNILVKLPTAELNVVSIEDPVEFPLPSITQVSVNESAGLMFQNALRHVVRQDPDVILVGEVRDLPTLQTALQASLTGHLCFTTLHTNNAIGAITRLIDMGAEPYLLASSLRAVVAQRLVRRLCTCAKPAANLDALREQYDCPDAHFMEPQGCSLCRGTGYRGRVGVFEILRLWEAGESEDSDVRERNDAYRRIVTNLRSTKSLSSESDLLAEAVRRGFRSLRADALRKAASGITSLAEVLTNC